MHDTILELLEHLSLKNKLQIKLTIGSGDTLNGYGWHSRYHLKVFEAVEYCPKCRKKTGLNYSDISHPLNNHQHLVEYKTIFDGTLYYDNIVSKLFDIHRLYN
jgi:hypothetical protein